MIKLNESVIPWLLGRLQEQSTWKGIFLAMTSIGIALRPEQVSAITAVGLAAVALVNVFRNETKATARQVDKALAANDAADLAAAPKPTSGGMKGAVLAGMGIVGLMGIMGCTNLATQVFRTEQTAVNLAYSGYVGWTNYLALEPGKVSAQASNEVRTARLRFAASVGTLESWRGAYLTNSAVQPQMEAALNGVLEQSSNVVWLIQYWKQP